MSRQAAEKPIAKTPRHWALRTGDHLRMVATLAGLFFLVAVVLMAAAPWVLLQPDQEVRAGLNRRFLTVRAVWTRSLQVLLVLAQRPLRTLFVVDRAAAIVVAGAIILPFQPTFAVVL